MSVESVVITVDGESKCGKTQVVCDIAEQANYQASTVSNLLGASDSEAWPLDDSTRQRLFTLEEKLRFKNVITVSAGSTFRAASLYKSLLEVRGESKSAFDETDADGIRELLAVEGIDEVLQNDPNVSRRVTAVSQLAGAQALCGGVFCDAVSEAYVRHGGGNLVIADARDPIGHMRRNGILGARYGHVGLSSIMPIYIDTPPEVAAARMRGDYDENLSEVLCRRHQDATRNELPVAPPTELVRNLRAWLDQFGGPIDIAATPYLLDNGAEMSLDNIQMFAGVVAATAQNLGCRLSSRCVAA